VKHATQAFLRPDGGGGEMATNLSGNKRQSALDPEAPCLHEERKVNGRGYRKKSVSFDTPAFWSNGEGAKQNSEGNGIEKREGQCLRRSINGQSKDLRGGREEIDRSQKERSGKMARIRHSVLEKLSKKLVGKQLQPHGKRTRNSRNLHS